MIYRDAAVIAETAWNQTKESADPEFKFCAFDHQQRLAGLVTVIEESRVGANVQGLEAFEAAVKQLLTLPVPTTPAPEIPEEPQLIEPLAPTTTRARRKPKEED